MWQTTSTPKPISPAATKPHSCETRLTTRTKLSMGMGTRRQVGTINKGRLAPPFDVQGLALFDAQRRVDQFLSVRNFLGELRIRAFPGDLDPLVVFGGRQRDHLDLVLLEYLDHLVIQALGLFREVRLRFPAGREQHVLLLLVEPAEALLRHQHRLVPEPQRVCPRRRAAFPPPVDPPRNQTSRAPT